MEMADAIAIVGSACRFPGSVNSPSQLWDLLQAPRDLLEEIPQERLENSGLCRHYDGHKYRSYLLQTDVRRFDAAFFKINNKEAQAMDPQQRILLETVFEALEAAGWPLSRMTGSSTSVHVGAMTTDYSDIHMRDPDTFPTYAATGLANSMLANRISYFFNFKGPSVTIDTACSSSLVALYQAVQCLRDGDASQAVVAGTSILLDPAMYVAETKLHMLSPDSRSRMWDKDASGYARGEGCAAILLKPLSRAIEDNDDVECIIRAVGVNSDGRTNGITMPSAIAQAELIRQTYKKAGLDPVKDRCQYFECHGTGTPAGDPVEARAIQESLAPGSSEQHRDSVLHCGSIKTVIGHLEGCAGIAGILKALLAIQNKAIPPNMHFNHLNPAIEPYYHNLNVPTSLLPWPETRDGIRRASVNSFGFGGTNAHAILESYKPSLQKFAIQDDSATHEGMPTKLSTPFLFSAHSHPALLRFLTRIMQYICSNPSLDLDSLSWLLHSRRSAFSTRIWIAATDRGRLLKSLEEKIDLEKSKNGASLIIPKSLADSGSYPKILGVFTGQVFIAQISARDTTTDKIPGYAMGKDGV